MGAKLTGMKELRRALEDLDKKTANKFTRIALASGAKVLKEAAAANAPKETGLLKKSIGVTIKRRKGVLSARIGPRKGFGKKVKVDGREEYRDPNKYGHIVEYNSKPYLRPAFDGKAGTAEARVGEKLGQLIEGKANG